MKDWFNILQPFSQDKNALNESPNLILKTALMYLSIFFPGLRQPTSFIIEIVYYSRQILSKLYLKTVMMWVRRLEKGQYQRFYNTFESKCCYAKYTFNMSSTET